MSAPTAATVDATADAFATLAARFDPTVIDLPWGRMRIRLEAAHAPTFDVAVEGGRARLTEPRGRADAVLAAGDATWRAVVSEPRGGVEAFGQGRLQVRRNLHLGVSFLAASDGAGGSDRLRFTRVETRAGAVAAMDAGAGDPLLALHGLGATKAAFLPTVHLLADSHRVIAIDLPGFGDSPKPLRAPYDAAWFAEVALDVLDRLGIERAHVVGNSMGGRAAIEVGLTAPDRIGGLVLLSPACPRGEGPWPGLLKLLRPELGALHPAPRALVKPLLRRLVGRYGGDGWRDAALDEFVRSYGTARGRAAFYAAARNIFLDEQRGPDGFWSRLGRLAPPALFVWGRQDPIVPLAHQRVVEAALPTAEHLILDCGHVPQVERHAETHAAIRRFLGTAAMPRL